MDGRKNNGGHSTKGMAGRPKKADEIKIIEQMDSIAVPEDAWRALWVKCQEGDTQAIKTWLNYRFGMPVQKTHTDGNLKIELPKLEWLDE
jgi:hypothetical protein